MCFRTNESDEVSPKGPGNEELYPEGEVDPIPSWVTDMVIKPIEEAGIVPKVILTICRIYNLDTSNQTLSYHMSVENGIHLLPTRKSIPKTD